jgi:hypothetical protein
MNVRTIVRAAAIAAALATGLAAQARDQRSAPIGMRAYVEQVVLPGGELEVAPATFATPVTLRLLRTWPHGDALRYDFEWVGLEAGRHDLARFLVRKDGSAATGLPELVVEVTSSRASGDTEPMSLTPEAPPRTHGYQTLQVVVAVAWIVGLLLILFVGRRFRRRTTGAPPAPTLADRLRPLVQAVAEGRADTAAKAELERLLVAFWRARLGLAEHNAADAIVAIKRDAEAGALLRQLEAWLHMPSPPGAVDVANLLQPYRAVTAASFEPLVREEKR